MSAGQTRSATLTVADLPARLLIALVRYARAHRSLLTTVSLLVVLALGASYLMFGALGVNPTASTITVRVHLAQSGGLLAGQDVALRGVPIGRVRSVDLARGAVVAIAEIDATVPVPDDGPVAVTSLSTAGEQFLDFRPTRRSGPFLTDGAEISPDRTTTPVPLWQMLGRLDGTLAQVDSAQLTAVIDELGVGPEGPAKLRDIIDGGTFLISTLDSVLPQTVGLLRDSKMLLTTLADGAGGLQRFAHDTSTLMRGVDAKTGGYVDLLNRAPATLAAMDAVLSDTAPVVPGLLAGLGSVAQLTNSRVPAFQEFFFPTQRQGSTLEAISTVIHDGGLWGLVNLYPRPTCDYDLPRHAPSHADYREPYLYTFCPNNDPSILVRGARNAPRPPGEQAPTGPPPGAPTDQTATPAPVGPMSLPIPLPLTDSGTPVPAPPR